ARNVTGVQTCALPISTYLVVYAAAMLDGGPTGAVCAAGGWVAMLVYLFGGRSEGDYLFASDWLGYTVLIGGLAAAGAGVVVAMRSEERRVGEEWMCEA